MRNGTIGLLISLLVIVGIIAGCGEQARELQPEILKVLSQTPALNATGVDYKDSLSITFKFPIDIRKFNINDLFASYGSSHTAGTPDLSAATYECSMHQKTITISGIKGWSNLTNGAGPKVVEIVAGAGKIKDIFKNEIHAGSTLWKFTLAGIGGVASVYPADGATGVSTSTQIRATFSDEMDASTINKDTFTVSGSTVTGTVTYDADTKTATFTPTLRLEAQHTYVATISASVKDKNGNELGSSYSWSFTTADEISPGILSVSPVNAATDVPTNTQVKVNFSGDMDASTISTNTFTLSGSIVTGTVSYNESTKRATFTPDNNLDEYKTYVATIAASVKDKNGNELGSSYTWSFTTADETAPTVLSVTPSNEATGEAINIVVTATFSEDMDDSTIDNTTFTLSGSQVTGNVSYDPGTRTATFVPSDYLSSLHTFEAALAASIKDANGNSLGTDEVWSFTTGSGVSGWSEHTIDGNFNGAISVYAVDVDGDNNIDVLGAARFANAITWWKNDGSENFTKYTIDGDFNAARSVYAVDVDGDNNIDVLGAAYGADAIVWWENDGSENFTAHTIEANFVGATSVYAVDVDGDNDIDVLGSAYGASDIVWWENDGSENFTAHTIEANFAGATSVYAVDVDGDNDIDVLGAARVADAIAWWENDGNQSFTKHIIDGNFDGAWPVYAVDVDGDNDIDVLGAAFDADDITWWENLGP